MDKDKILETKKLSQQLLKYYEENTGTCCFAGNNKVVGGVEKNHIVPLYSPLRVRVNFRRVYSSRSHARLMYREYLMAPLSSRITFTNSTKNSSNIYFQERHKIVIILTSSSSVRFAFLYLSAQENPMNVFIKLKKIRVLPYRRRLINY